MVEFGFILNAMEKLMRHFNQRGDKNPTVLKIMWLLVKIGLQRSKRGSKENRQEAKALARWFGSGWR